MSTTVRSEHRTKLAAQLLQSLTDSGLTFEETDALLKYAVSLIDSAERRGIDPTLLADEDMDKVAYGFIEPTVNAIGGLVAGAANKTTGLLADVGRTAVKQVPTALAAGLAIPTAGAYFLGRHLAQQTDNPEERIRAIQQREIVNLLEENARIARQQQQIEEGRTALTPTRKRPARRRRKATEDK